MIVEELCPMPIDDGCMMAVDEGLAGLCNGADDDCDGMVDELCSCDPGVNQPCFTGAPGRRGIGGCQDGTQVCINRGEFGGEWGACTGGIRPSAEACDDLDNDCNGCTDEVSGCVPAGSCPGPDDPRVMDGRPFSSYDLRGGDFFTAADATSWHWDVTGTPCDRMFQAIPGSTATATNGLLSFQLFDAMSENARIQFTLSGDYTVTLTVTRADGSIFTCTWIVHVRAPGLRVEACWDATGPTASMFGGTVDVDLHLGKHGTTPRWFHMQDCDYSTCTAGDTGADWGYPDTPIMNCSGPGARGGFVGSCPNPRLDLDNIAIGTEYRPENINVDNPANGDMFRIMVNHFSGDRLTHPLVTVYCGGEIVGTFGAPPDLVTDFDTGSGDGGADMWRVADVTMMVDAMGTTTGCEIVPIHPPLMTSGYSVIDGDPTF
jgi:hypothetical protein